MTASFSCRRASIRYAQSSGQFTVTSRSLPQQMEQMSPPTPGQWRRGLRVSQILHFITVVFIVTSPLETSEGLLIRPQEEAVGHPRNVVAHHAMHRRNCQGLHVVLRQFVRMQGVELE